MIIVTQTPNQEILELCGQDRPLVKFLYVEKVDFGDFFEKCDLALRIVIAINQIADQHESILIADSVQIKDRNLGHILAMLILKEIRINPYLEGSKSKIRKSKIIIQTQVPPQLYFRQEPLFSLAFSPLVDVIETLEELPSLIKSSQQFLSEIELHKVRNYLPTPEAIDSLDNRHNHASVLGVFQLYRFARYFYEESPELHKKYAEPKILPELGLSSSIRDRLFIHRFNLPKEKVNITEVKQLIDQIHSQLATKNNTCRKIALIDDEANQLYHGAKLGAAWCSALNTILFSENCVIDVLKECDVDLNNRQNFVAKISTVIEHIKSLDPVCILLDVRLLSKEIQLGEPTEKAGKSGLQLLAKLRTAFPALPVIMITSSSEVWTHRRLINLGADAVWMKEGLDESRAPLQSYYNVIRLLELIRRVSGSHYQVISRLGKKLQQIQEACRTNEKKFWWQKSEVIAWPDGNVYNGHLNHFYSFAIPEQINKKLPVILSDVILLLKKYLKLTDLEFDESDIGKDYGEQICESDWAKLIVIHMAKSIELIHGYEMSHRHENRVNAGIIGGYPSKVSYRSIEAVRGDWIAFGLYQLRNECAHYLGEVHYSFGILNQDPRSLVYFAAHLFAYLTNPYQPYHSKQSLDFPWLSNGQRNRLLPPEYLENLIEKHLLNPSMQSHKQIFNEILFNGD